MQGKFYQFGFLIFQSSVDRDCDSSIALKRIATPVFLLQTLMWQVTTNLMAAIDVDMMISTSLAEQLSDPNLCVRSIYKSLPTCWVCIVLNAFCIPSFSVRLKQFERDALERRAIVLPAFEPQRQGWFGRTVADEASKGQWWVHK